MLVLGGLADDSAQARTALQGALDSGAAAERFARMVKALGGPGDLLEQPERHLPLAAHKLAIPAPRSGFVQACDCRALGMAVVGLGGGRTDPAARIDFAVGLDGFAQIGDAIENDQPLGFVYARDSAAAQQAINAVQADRKSTRLNSRQ